MKGGVLAAVAAAILSLPGISGAEHRVTLRTPDGTPLTATVYEPDDRPAPAVVLLHMLRRSRHDWDAAAERLQRAGFFVLAPDLRGHGDSMGSAGSSLDVLVQDAQAAITYARSRPGVLPDRVGVAGASLGASLAALAAGSDAAIRSLALLSPSLDYRGLRCEAAMRKYGDRPVLLIAAARDSYAVRSARQIATGGTDREVLITETPGHGTVLLSRNPELVDRLVDWFRRTLL
jgi:dienelactone hydrolase